MYICMYAHTSAAFHVRMANIDLLFVGDKYMWIFLETNRFVGFDENFPAVS